MMYNIPQFIDIEDKIAGPFTWKQLGWLIAMIATIALIYFSIGGTVAVVLSIPVALLFLALMFYRPNGMSFAAYLLNFFFFLFRPKLMMWDRPVNSVVKLPPQKQPLTNQKQRNTVTLEEIRNIAAIVDRK